MSTEIEIEQYKYQRTGLTFKQAYALLEAGYCVRRAEWLGYWKADKSGDVVMHCKDGRRFSMKQGCVPMFTLGNTLKNDWLYVDDAHRDELDRIHSLRIMDPSSDQAKAEKLLKEGN